MAEITLKGRITVDHKLTAEVPEEVPAGEVDIVVRLPRTVTSDNRRMIEFLEELQRQPGRRNRSKEDIDRQIEEERNSWD